MLIALALLMPAIAKPLDLSGSQGITVDYTMTTKGTTTCVSTFRGTGAAPVVAGDRITFTGTWTLVSDTCGQTIWVPADGAAHHTLRLDKGGKAVDEWIVHGKAEDHTRFTSNISAQGQYWINELAGVPDKGAFAYSVTETQGVFPLSIEITHDLKIALSTAAPAPVEPPTP